LHQYHISGKEVWSLWALLAIFACSQISYFLAVLALPKGRPPSRGNANEWVFGLSIVMFAGGLLLAARTMG
jgi:hypothetical protein